MENKEKNMQDKIENWKKKYGDIFMYESDGKICYLKKPSRKTLGAAAVVGQNDPMKYNEILLNNCWLSGDKELKTDDSYFLGLSAKLSELVEIKEGEIKKL